MKNYCFIVGYCLGFCHSGGVEVDDRVSVELADDEVNELLKILRERGTNYFYRTDLERESPKLYKKLHGTFRHTAYIASELHWLNEELSILLADMSLGDEVKEYCKNELGYEFDFEYDEADYLDKEGHLDTEKLEKDRAEEENYDFYEWLEDYLNGLDTEPFLQFMYEHMGSEAGNEDEIGDYWVEPPQEILQLIEA